MKYPIYLAATVVAIASTAALAADPANLALFSTSLKNAQRSQLRSAISKMPLKPIRISDDYWSDIYDARADMEGASKLSMLYSSQEEFAAATYTFPSHMDIEQAKRIESMVIAKYGNPSSTKGAHNQGPLVVTWELPKGMSISMFRGWPDTTTQLSFEDTAIRSKTAQQRAAERN